MKTEKLRVADFGGDPVDLLNNNEKSLFCCVTVDWSRPKALFKSGKFVLDDEDYLEKGYLYSVVKNHGNDRYKDRIVYVGITKNIHSRFDNHPKFNQIRSLRGQSGLSIGTVKFEGRRLSNEDFRYALEELEHLYIWVLWHDLLNDKKNLTVPGQGINGGSAWDVSNENYRFEGRMPKRIVFPWAVIEPRRNTSRKAT